MLTRARLAAAIENVRIDELASLLGEIRRREAKRALCGAKTHDGASWVAQALRALANRIEDREDACKFDEAFLLCAREGFFPQVFPPAAGQRISYVHPGAAPAWKDLLEACVRQAGRAPWPKLHELVRAGFRIGDDRWAAAIIQDLADVAVRSRSLGAFDPLMQLSPWWQRDTAARMDATLFTRSAYSGFIAGVEKMAPLIQGPARKQGLLGAVQAGQGMLVWNIVAGVSPMDPQEIRETLFALAWTSNAGRDRETLFAELLHLGGSDFSETVRSALLFRTMEACEQELAKLVIQNGPVDRNFRDRDQRSLIEAATGPDSIYLPDARREVAALILDHWLIPDQLPRRYAEWLREELPKYASRIPVAEFQVMQPLIRAH